MKTVASREQQLIEALRHADHLLERLDEAMAAPERIAADKRLVGSFVSSLNLTETADEIVERAIRRLTCTKDSQPPRGGCG